MNRLPGRATDDDARAHMARRPGHQVSVDIDDQWVCYTCEDETESEDRPQVYSLDALTGVVYADDRYGS